MRNVTSSVLAAEDDNTLSAVALARIVSLIRSGELRPGQIVNETELAKQFGISRGPVREAVRQLQGRKLVTREAYQRARVAVLDFAQIRDIYELRECVEGMACRLATQRMSDRELEDLAKAVDLTRNQHRSRSSIDADYPFNFHETIVSLCGNAKLQETLTSELYDLIRLYRWSAQVNVDDIAQRPTAHWQICRAMLARDADLAESLMRTHIQQVLSKIQMLTSAKMNR